MINLLQHLLQKINLNSFVMLTFCLYETVFAIGGLSRLQAARAQRKRVPGMTLTSCSGRASFGSTRPRQAALGRKPPFVRWLWKGILMSDEDVVRADFWSESTGNCACCGKQSRTIRGDWSDSSGAKAVQ